MEENTGELKGISKNIFDHIAESTGLKFEFVPVGSYDELQQMMQEKKIDVIAGANYDYNAAEEQELSLTRPYLTSQIIMAVNKNVDSDHIKGKKLALPDGVVYEGKYASEVQRYRSPEDCLKAVAKEMCIRDRNNMVTYDFRGLFIHGNFFVEVLLMNSLVEKPKFTTRNITSIAVMAALSIVLVYLVRIPMFLPFLEYDPADIPIFITAFALSLIHI